MKGRGDYKRVLLQSLLKRQEKKCGSRIASSLKKTKAKPLKTSYMGVKKDVSYSKPKVNQPRDAV